MIVEPLTLHPPSFGVRHCSWAICGLRAMCPVVVLKESPSPIPQTSLPLVGLTRALARWPIRVESLNVF